MKSSDAELIVRPSVRPAMTSSIDPGSKKKIDIEADMITAEISQTTLSLTFRVKISIVGYFLALVASVCVWGRLSQCKVRHADSTCPAKLRDTLPPVAEPATSRGDSESRRSGKVPSESEPSATCVWPPRECAPWSERYAMLLRHRVATGTTPVKRVSGWLCSSRPDGFALHTGHPPSNHVGLGVLSGASRCARTESAQRVLRSPRA